MNKRQSEGTETFCNLLLRGTMHPYVSSQFPEIFVYYTAPMAKIISRRTLSDGNCVTEIKNQT